MKILYAIQGTGNGHLARATEIIPHLKKVADVDILVSGLQGDLKLPFEIKYRYTGLSFFMGVKGGINYWKTMVRMRPFRLLADIANLPVYDYDIVFSDFEPVSAWSCLLKGKPCIGISHQNAVLHPSAPKPWRNDLAGKLILTNYAPTSAKYGFHFNAIDEKHFIPIIRSGIRNANPLNLKHYTVYLPAYSDKEIVKALFPFKEFQWQVFSKNCTEAYQVSNIRFQPVSLKAFTHSFVNCEGILCTAGFETPSEALFMGKKLCVVPMKNQYEQLCNATFLEKMGVKVIHNLKKETNVLAEWIQNGKALQLNYPDETKQILHRILTKHEAEEEFSILNWIFPNQSLRTLQFKMIALRENHLIPLNFGVKHLSKWKEFLKQLMN